MRKKQNLGRLVMVKSMCLLTLQLRLPVLFQGVLIKLKLWIPLALGLPSKTRCSCSSNYCYFSPWLPSCLLMACCPSWGSSSLPLQSSVLLQLLSSATLWRGRQRLWLSLAFYPWYICYRSITLYLVFYRIIILIFQWEYIALLLLNLKCNLINVPSSPVTKIQMKLTNSVISHA